MYHPDILKEESQQAPPKHLLGGKYVSIERRSPDDTVFLVDDSPFRSSMPKPTHWSIAWSDLMMTMFILFLSMYVYQTANRDFLTHEKPEVIGGDTAEALETDQFASTGLPFVPISPALPLTTSGTVKKVESIALQEIDIGTAFRDRSSAAAKLPAAGGYAEAGETQSTEKNREAAAAFIVGSLAEEEPKLPMADQGLIDPRPLTVERSAPPARDQIGDIYRLSKETLASNNLEEFASLDLVPDKTMRIILTGDLLFDGGRADLTFESLSSLQKIASVIQKTPYMINIVGHTDNAPMHSERFASNWELSLARASTVARFLIEEMYMNPSQFVVSGYSSFRPLVPNTTSKNRAKNRRVEIIISKRLPQPVAATFDNLP